MLHLLGVSLDDDRAGCDHGAGDIGDGGPDAEAAEEREDRHVSGKGQRSNGRRRIGNGRDHRNSSAEAAAAEPEPAAHPPPATTSEWTPPPAAATSTPVPLSRLSDYPVVVDIPTDPGQNRLWGIPLFGVLVRWILLIPHFFVLWILAIVLGLLFLVSWIPVLVNGRQSEAIVNFLAGFYRWTTRATSYGLLLTGTYPPFSLSD